MSAQVIPFDQDAPQPAPVSIEQAWADFEAAQRYASELVNDPASNSRTRMDASIRAIRLYRVFVAAVEAL